MAVFGQIQLVCCGCDDGGNLPSPRNYRKRLQPLTLRSLRFRILALHTYLSFIKADRIHKVAQIRLLQPVMRRVVALAQDINEDFRYLPTYPVSLAICKS